MKFRLGILLSIVSITCFAQEIGLQLYSVRNQNPAEIKATLAMIRSWGITQLEGGGTYGLSAEEFLTLCRENGLKLVSIGADFNELETDVPKVIERAKAMNVKYVVCYWLPHEGDVFTLADADRAISVFTQAGMKLALTSFIIRMDMSLVRFLLRPPNCGSDSWLSATPGKKPRWQPEQNLRKVKWEKRPA
jgi:hypothetical protein